MGAYRQSVLSLGDHNGWERHYSLLLAAGKKALPDILVGLEHSDWRIRKWCTAFLDHNADKTCSDGLQSALNDPVAEVRRHAVHSIGCQSCKPSMLRIDVVAALIRSVEYDPSIRVRRVAAHMLGCQPPDSRAKRALLRIVAREKDSKLLTNAEWALTKHGAAVLHES